VLALVLAVFVFRDGAAYMWQVWGGNEEYGYAYLVPFISAFLVWQKSHELSALQFTGSWTGVLVVLLGVVLGMVGQMASAFTVQQIGLVVAIWGFVLALTGWTVARLLWMPLLLLLFMIPLPRFLQVSLSSEMQLWSSALGVWFIRLMGISVYLEGNVIDLGVYKLQVVEACDGLRYLFPLLTLGLVMAYVYQGAFWKRAVIFLSSVPITILMNSLRIAVIGWMVEHWGVGMAEGFLHDFQGWAVFMVSLAMMVLLMIALSRVGSDRRPWRELFGLEFPEPLSRDVVRAPRALPGAAIVSCAVLAAATAASIALPQRIEVLPARQAFLDFPMVIGSWLGERRTVPPDVIQALQFNDYVVADFQGEGSSPINLYVAWYDSQRAGRSVHSPRTCLPGGGWQIVEFDQVEVPGVQVAGRPLRVNRAVMALGDERQLVYYWFQQRGRVITNEYLAKAYLFWDSLLRNRTDGALVRLVVDLPGGEQSSQADRQLAQFAQDVGPVLDVYIPR
jgi:exosortase D (VPLPA-CTERM-specific)